MGINRGVTGRCDVQGQALLGPPGEEQLVTLSTPVFVVHAVSALLGDRHRRVLAVLAFVAHPLLP